MSWREKPPQILCLAFLSWFAIVIALFNDAGVAFPTGWASVFSVLD
jgi:hypothetical protein